MYKTGIYCRVSSEEKDKEEEYSNSIYSQIRMAEDYIAEQEDVAEVKVYIDDGISGSTFNRLEFRRMLADIELGVIDMVIFKDVSRLGREHIDTNYYLQKYFPERNIRVVCLLDRYDSKVCTYDELLEIRTLMNDMYLRDTSKKIRSAIQTKRCMGEYTYSEPPFGYIKSQTVHNHLEIDPYAAEIVRRIFRMYLDGVGCTIITRVLNEENVPSPGKYKKDVLKRNYSWDTGKGIWSASMVNNILKNPVYTGAIVLRKYHKPSYKLKYKKEIPLDERELIEDTHEAIISKADFEQAKQVRANNRVPYFDENKEPHKYVGLLFCGKCGTVMRKRYLASKKRFDGFICGFHQRMGKKYCEQNLISGEVLDGLVTFTINQQLKIRQEELKGLDKDVLGAKRNSDLRVSGLEATINKNKEYLKKAYEQFMDEFLTKEEYLELKHAYQRENEQCENELSGFHCAEQRQQEVMREITGWLGWFQNGSITEKELTRDILVELIDRINVYPGQKIEIFFKFEGKVPET